MVHRKSMKQDELRRSRVRDFFKQIWKTLKDYFFTPEIAHQEAGPKL